MRQIEDAFEFGLASTPAEKQRIYALRAKHYLMEAPYLLGKNEGTPGKDRFDACSLIFYLQRNDEIVATSRLTPFHDGHWEVSEALPAEMLPFDPGVFAQFNRILVDDRFRNRSLHELMFFLACEWSLANTAIRKYFSVCTVSHYRFYKNYGASRAWPDPFLLAGRGDTRYLLVQGTLEDARRLTHKQLSQKEHLPDPLPPLPRFSTP